MNCKECTESLKPENPTVAIYHPKLGRLKPLCHGCENSDSGNPRLEIEEVSARITFLEEHDVPVDRHMRQALTQLTGRVNYLDRLVKELQQVKKGKQGNEIES